MGGYIGEVKFPVGRPTLPDYVHLVGPQAIYPPILSPSTDIYAGVYAPGTPEDGVVWQYDVGHPYTVAHAVTLIIESAVFFCLIIHLSFVLDGRLCA